MKLKRKRQRKTTKKRSEKHIGMELTTFFGGGGREVIPFLKDLGKKKYPAVLAKIPFQLPLSVLIGDSPHPTEALWR